MGLKLLHWHHTYHTMSSKTDILKIWLLFAFTVVGDDNVNDDDDDNDDSCLLTD